MRRTPVEDSARRGRGARGESARGVDDGREGRDDRAWFPVYAAVVLVTALVIAALWLFSRAFSS